MNLVIMALSINIGVVFFVAALGLAIVGEWMGSLICFIITIMLFFLANQSERNYNKNKAS